VLLAGYGGQINAAAPTDTAAVARDSVLKIQYANFWTDAADDDANVAWLRKFYQSVYAEIGGVPVPNSVTGGTFIRATSSTTRSRSKPRSRSRSRPRSKYRPKYRPRFGGAAPGHVWRKRSGTEKRHRGGEG
jgi:hypothetical protein